MGSVHGERHRTDSWWRIHRRKLLRDPPVRPPTPRPNPDLGTGSRIDWDGVFTFVLTVLAILIGFGLPLLLTTVAVLAVGLRARTGPAHSSTLVVPGKRLISAQPDRDFKARLLTAGRLAAARQGSRLVILGGRTGGGSCTEAEPGERYLRACLPGTPLRISLEPSSRDTLTNLQNLRALLGSAHARQPLALVSNRYHLARLGLMAKSQGLNCQLIAAESVRSGLRVDRVLSWMLEGYYVSWFVTGKPWARVTSNRRMLGRVT